ncbi:MAG: ribonuclease Z [Paludibacteraceae bacterium]|nr:ribonuclease Z [Paludibacteraceae bacterium]
MEYSLRILGSGSAKPSVDRFQTCQILEMRERQFLIDCGEGAQTRLRQYNSRTSRLNHIFISHLHGDHCLGLVGLLSTFGMLGRMNDLVIHSHPLLEKILGEQIRFFAVECHFRIFFEPFNPDVSEIIYEDKAVTVRTLPLKHTVPTCGFLFEEKPLSRHINKEMVDAFNVPIAYYKDLKEGKDFITPDGEIVSNRRLTIEPSERKRMAYMSDTAYSERNLRWIEGVDLLYHESTYLSDVDKVKLKTRMHSSAAQAAQIAYMAGAKKLVLGHYSSSYKSSQPFQDEARKIFPESYAANDGDTFEF